MGKERRVSDANINMPVQLAELEAELEEAKDELLVAREELDELKTVQIKQRIQLL